MFVVLTHMECFLFKFFVRRTISIVYTLIHVWYCNCNIGRKLIDHLPFLHSIDLRIVFFISFSIHTIVYSNLSYIYIYIYIYISTNSFFFFFETIYQLIVIGHNEGI